MMITVKVIDISVRVCTKYNVQMLDNALKNFCLQKEIDKKVKNRRTVNKC